MRVTNLKNCYCHTCKKAFHYLGIARHRRGHLDRKENCEITYTNGDTYCHKFRKYKGVKNEKYILSKNII